MSFSEYNIDMNSNMLPSELPFPQFIELIRSPLEQDDPSSYKQITSLLLDTSTRLKDPFKFIILQLTGRTIRPIEAPTVFGKIINHKKKLAQILGRNVSIRVAALDYLDSNTTSEHNSQILLPQSPIIANSELPVDRPFNTATHLQRLKEEILRSNRYKHSLSALLIDIDHFHTINENFSFKIGDEALSLLVKIIEKTVRTVDILARHSSDQFLLILPNTNKREATELAQRLVNTVKVRSKKLPGLPIGFSITVSVHQRISSDTSNSTIQTLENLLARGKQQSREAVYTS